MLELAAFLDLPRFPDITGSCFLHPDMLCIKYLMEANLPGKYFPKPELIKFFLVYETLAKRLELLL